MAHSTDDLEQQSQERHQRGHHWSTAGTEGPSSSATCSSMIRGVAGTIRESLMPYLFSRCRRSGPPLSPPPPARVHHVWPGKNVFFFDGRVICGPDPRGLIVTAMAVFLSEWMFLADVVVGGKLTHPTLISASSLILAATVAITLLLTATRDPGIIPRSSQVSSSLEDEEEAGILRSARSTPSRFTILSNGVAMRLRFCRVCKMFCPPRTSHCAVCDNCVERFHHHCTWLSQCIGLRNYRLYLLLICSATAFYAFMLPFTITRIGAKLDSNTREGVLLHRVMTYLEPVALAGLNVVALCFFVYLLAFNAFLVAKNKTSHEEQRGRHHSSPNPYDEGTLGNIKECLFQKLPPPRVDFRAVAEPDPGLDNGRRPRTTAVGRSPAGGAAPLPGPASNAGGY